MAAAQVDQFTQALFGKVESVLIVCAFLILVIGIPLYWVRLKAERALIRVIRSSREKRQTQKTTANKNSSETVPHCPVCNALMVKRLARRGVSAGSSFWGCSNYPKCRGHASDLTRGITSRSRSPASPCELCSLPDGVPARRVAELVFWTIVGGQEVLRRKVSLRCAPKPVRKLVSCRRKNQLL